MTIHGDPVRLTQVLLNLLSNAAKYTIARGVISLRVSQEDHHAVIRVRDNGCGISPELLPHVFDLFVQGDRAPQNSQTGLGVGLTIVLKLVELHGGQVNAFSGGIGQGSEFVVRLPLNECSLPK
jgi:signal transduction histidine kinase